MRTWPLLGFLLLAGPALALAQDPVEVASDQYSVIFENDQVRVLKIHYSPGAASVMHSHPDGVAIFLADRTARFTLPDGTTMDAAGKAGDAIWAPAGPHAVENVSDGDLDVILVELKDDAEDDD